jgi:acetyltransferase
MTTRNLDALFQPRSIALVGSSNREGSVGAVLARNLLESGFAGPVMPVNPHETSVRSVAAYARVAELPQTPDLAVIATPAAAVPGIIADLGARGCRAAVVISAGFEGAAEPGRALRQAMLHAAKPHLLRVLGPNCLGFISPGRGINASFAHLTPKAGDLALVTQSGAIAAAALDWAQPQGIGFSHLVSIGDAADIDVGDLLDHLAADFETKAILLYIESVTDARKFMSAGRRAARAKPVVVIKAGRSAAGAKAALTHTGAMAGSDAVYDAACRRAGMLRVGELRELFDAVSMLSAGLSVSGDRLAVLTNGGGAGVLAVDALDARGGRLAELSPATLKAIDQTASKNWSRRNPVDILGDAQPPAYEAALGAILADPGVDAALVMNCPTAVADSGEAARATARAVGSSKRGKPVLTCWLGEQVAAPARRELATAGLPTHETPDEAVRAFMHLVDHRRNQQLLLQTPAIALAIPDRSAARAIVEAALQAGRTALTDPEARGVLKAYGVPVVESRSVADARAAGEAAAALQGPFALKILSHDISHKSDVGGVTLGLVDADSVRDAAAVMLARVKAALPMARIEGFVVEPMIARTASEELIVGIVQDAAFGPVILFGQGGVAAEVLADRTLGLPPLNDVLAKDMIGRTRVARLLAGYRDRPAANLTAITQVLVALSALAADLPEVAELDINPLLADASGVVALDARMAVRRPDAGTPRMAILPYPETLSRQVVTTAGEPLTLRPVRPQDAPKLIALVRRCARQDVRLRFNGAMRQLSPDLAALLSQIDYDRQMAFVAEDASGDILGVARLVSDPQGQSGEYALLVRSDRQQHGLGTQLLEAILDYAGNRGLQEVWGDVARNNNRMLELAKELGFERQGAPDLARVRVVKRSPVDA